MTSEDPMIIAVEARSEAKAANQRLDRMNGSIDRLAGNVERVDTKVDQILLQLASEAGASRARQSFVISRRFVITTVVALIGTSLFTMLVTWSLSRH